jgi:ParB family chromosome partitioning protein
MTIRYEPGIRKIPIRLISVLNPRHRGKKKFAQIVANIARLGLKKPVTVALAEVKDGEPRYDLVCGQGRLEAYIALGQEEIHAMLVEGTREELLLMSLVENLARRTHSAVELVRRVKELKERGYTHAEIARKTDLDVSYIRGILQLLDRGRSGCSSRSRRATCPSASRSRSPPPTTRRSSGPSRRRTSATTCAARRCSGPAG